MGFASPFTGVMKNHGETFHCRPSTCPPSPIDFPVIRFLWVVIDLKSYSFFGFCCSCFWFNPSFHSHFSLTDLQDLPRFERRKITLPALREERPWPPRILVGFSITVTYSNIYSNIPQSLGYNMLQHFCCLTLICDGLVC